MCLYGVPSVYGVVSMPFGVREGINVFLDGLIPTENLRFREEALTFRLVESIEDRPDADIFRRFDYPSMHKTYNLSDLTSKLDSLPIRRIIVMLGRMVLARQHSSACLLVWKRLRMTVRGA